jgi:hypothetical protein
MKPRQKKALKALAVFLSLRLVRSVSAALPAQRPAESRSKR